MRLFPVFLLLLTALLLAEPIQWDLCPELMPGVRLARFEETEPQLMKVNILRIDLSIPGLLFAGTPRARGWGNPMPDYPQGIIRTFRQTTKDFMLWNRTPWAQGGRRRNMIVAINSVPWTPWCKPFTHTYAEPPGLMVSNGVLVADNPQKHHAEFVVYRDGRPDIVSDIPREDYPKIWLAACGFAIIMKDGKITCGENADTHPRTVYGLSQDRRWLFLMTVDGRQKDWSIGARDIDSARLMEKAGAWDAINMDGGGSTTMCYWDFAKQEPVILSKNAGNATRKVGGNIGIYIDPVIFRRFQNKTRVQPTDKPPLRNNTSSQHFSAQSGT